MGESAAGTLDNTTLGGEKLSIHLEGGTEGRHCIEREGGREEERGMKRERGEGGKEGGREGWMEEERGMSRGRKKEWRITRKSPTLFLC